MEDEEQERQKAETQATVEHLFGRWKPRIGNIAHLFLTIWFTASILIDSKSREQLKEVSLQIGQIPIVVPPLGVAIFYGLILAWFFQGFTTWLLTIVYYILGTILRWKTIRYVIALSCGIAAANILRIFFHSEVIVYVIFGVCTAVSLAYTLEGYKKTSNNN